MQTGRPGRPTPLATDLARLATSEFVTEQAGRWAEVRALHPAEQSTTQISGERDDPCVLRSRLFSQPLDSSVERQRGAPVGPE